MDGGLLIIVGSGRSGTVYLSNLLKDVYSFGLTSEPKFVYTWYDKYFREVDFSNPEEVLAVLKKIYNGKLFWNLNHRKKIETNFDDLVERVDPYRVTNYEDVILGVFRYVADVRKRELPAYKDPLDVNYVKELADLLPNSRFLHVIRDGRDVANSLLRLPWGATNLFTGLEFWAKGVTKGRVDGARLERDRYLEIRFEDLITKPSQTAEQLDQFLLPFRKESRYDQLLSYLKENNDEKAVFRWKKNFSVSEKKLSEKTHGKLLAELGYEISDYILLDKGISPIERLFYRLMDFVKRVFNVVVYRKRRVKGRKII